MTPDPWTRCPCSGCEARRGASEPTPERAALLRPLTGADVAATWAAAVGTWPAPHRLTAAGRKWAERRAADCWETFSDVLRNGTWPARDRLPVGSEWGDEA